MLIYNSIDIVCTFLNILIPAIEIDAPLRKADGGGDTLAVIFQYLPHTVNVLPSIGDSDLCLFVLAHCSSEAFQYVLLFLFVRAVNFDFISPIVEIQVNCFVVKREFNLFEESVIQLSAVLVRV